MWHTYPKELTDFIDRHWEIPCSEVGFGEVFLPRTSSKEPLPDRSVLELLISTCYQASLLREEERTVKFRLILYEPSRLSPEQGPPKGLHRLVFTDPLPFNEYELRKLSSSADFYHSLIGIRMDGDRGLQIWGLIHTGQRWVQTLYGGGKTFQPLPEALVIHVTSPGRISICKGSATIAILNAGKIICPSMDVLDSNWMREIFDSARAHAYGLHMKARESSDRPWAPVQSEFFRIIKKQVMMRVISRIRHSRHGGTLVCIPQRLVDELSSENPFVEFKYRFTEEEPRSRFVTLTVTLANALAEAYGAGADPERLVGWDEYLASKNRALSQLDEAIFEWAHLVAGLAAVDGAVFFSRRFELIGFGGEISGKLDKVEHVLKALDLEGKLTAPEQTGWVGTRHHSVYRLCNVLHEVVAMVISQDGNIQIVKWKDNAVTCWDQVATSVMDI